MPVVPDDPNMAQAWITGDPPDQTIDFYIPRGNQGLQGPVGPIGPSLAVGDILTTTGPAAPGTIGATGLTGAKGDPGGFAASTILTNPTSFDTIIVSGLYFNPVSNSAAAPGPAGTGGHLEVIIAASWVYQRYTPMGENRGTYVRNRNSSSVWNSWRVINATRVDQTAGRAIYQWDDLNNREQIIYGDTGWRNITTVNGWTVAGLQIRRVGSIVSLRFYLLDPATATDTVFVTIPSGFRIGVNTTVGVIEPSGAVGPLQMLDTGNAYLPTSRIYGNGLYCEVSYNTMQAWPVTLPGTAAGSIPNL